MLKTEERTVVERDKTRRVKTGKRGEERRRQSGKPNAIMSGGDKSTTSRKKMNTVRLKRTSEQGQRTGSPDERIEEPKK